MAYKKLNLELIVFAEDAEAVTAELNAELDRMEEKHTIFDGAIETADVEHRGARRRSALMHTRVAGELAAGAVRTAGEKVAGALRQIL